MAGFGAFAPVAYDPMTGLPIGADTERTAPEAIPNMATRGIIQAVAGLPKAVMWDLPHRAVQQSMDNPLPGLRREDFTDIPADTSPDPASPLGGIGVTQFGRIGWQPVDPMVGSSLETGMNVMGGTSLSAPAGAAGAGPVRAARTVLDLSPEARLAQTQSPQFKEWFGSGKLVDRDGNPQVVYHGSTSRGIDAFDTSRVTNRTERGDLPGTYFTDDPGHALNYTRRKGSPERGEVVPAYLNLQNPLDTTDAIKRFQKQGLSFGDAKRKAMEALDDTHDGVIFRGNSVNPPEYIAFKPEQIKSATRNSGEFSGSNPSIFGAGAADRRAAGAVAAADIERGVAPEFTDWYAAVKGAAHEPAAEAKLAAVAPESAAAADPGLVGSGGGGAAGAGGLEEAQAAAARWAGARKPLEGLPGPLKIGDRHFVPGPIGRVHDVAEEYMKSVGRPYTPPTKYHPIDVEHAQAIAKAFDEMPHAPNDPKVKASYEALADETMKQYQAIKKTGLKIEPIKPGMPDPYATNPRLAAIDVAENNHLWFFPTEGGYGQEAGKAIKGVHENPMLRPTGEKIGDHELLANDMFRVVHDYFGHLKQGHGFRAAGEDNAWRGHSAMYSDLARPAMTTETRGQNSWLNYGPHGEKNRTASTPDTIFAEQKIGLMPEWTMRDRDVVLGAGAARKKAAAPTIAANVDPPGWGPVEMVPVESLRPRPENTAMIEKMKRVDAEGQAAFEAAYPGEKYTPYPGDMRFKVDELRKAIREGREIPPLAVGRDGLIMDGENRFNAYLAEGSKTVPVRRSLDSDWHALTDDVARGPAGAVPEVAERYPAVAPPVEAIDKTSGKPYLAKQLSPEAEDVQAARLAAQKDIDAGNYTPYFDPAKRFDVDPAGYPEMTDTRSIVKAKPDTRAKYDALARDPEATKRLDEAFERGMKQKDDAGNWYHMGQLEAEFIKEYGPVKGRELFKERFADSMAATTGGADPTSNLMMAHYGNYLKARGEKVPDASYKFPFPIGGRYVTGNMAQFDKMIEKGAGVTTDNPKRYNFSNNFIGGKGATLDEQMSGLFDPKMAMPPAGSYGHYEAALADRAAAAGVDPRYYQEVAWAGAKDAKMKGKYKASPMISHVNAAIERTHRITGMPREEIVRRGLVRAEIPLYGLGGAAVFGSMIPREE